MGNSIAFDDGVDHEWFSPSALGPLNDSGLKPVALRVDIPRAMCSASGYSSRYRASTSSHGRLIQKSINSLADRPPPTRPIG